MDKITLGELLAHPSETVRRHAKGCLAELQKLAGILSENQALTPEQVIAKAGHEQSKCVICGDDIYGEVQVHHHNEKCPKCGYMVIATQPHHC